MLVLQSLYKLSGEQVEYQVRDRLSFTRFLGLGIEDGIPDGTTLWLFQETLAKADLVEKLFERLGQLWRPRATLRVAARWCAPAGRGANRARRRVPARRPMASPHPPSV
jgi:Transposase domain (DUF772)